MQPYISVQEIFRVVNSTKQEKHGYRIYRYKET